MEKNQEKSIIVVDVVPRQVTPSHSQVSVSPNSYHRCGYLQQYTHMGSICSIFVVVVFQNVCPGGGGADAVDVVDAFRRRSLLEMRVFAQTIVVVVKIRLLY